MKFKIYHKYSPTVTQMVGYHRIELLTRIDVGVLLIVGSIDSPVYTPGESISYTGGTPFRNT